MRREQVHASAVQHHGLGAALRAALDKPGTGNKPRWPDAVITALVCARCNACTLEPPQVRS